MSTVNPNIPVITLKVSGPKEKNHRTKQKTGNWWSSG